MKIKRKNAIKLLKHCHKNPKFIFPFIIVCREYSIEDNDFVEIASNEWKNIKKDKNYKTFELREK